MATAGRGKKTLVDDAVSAPADAMSDAAVAAGGGGGAAGCDYDKSVFFDQTTIGDSTKRAYDYGIKRLLNLVSGGRKTLRGLLNDPLGTHKILRDAKLERKTMLSTLASIMAYMRFSGMKDSAPKLDKRWHDIYRPYLKVEDFISGENKATQKQKAAFVEWKTLESRRDELGRTDFGSMDHLLLCMYSMIPPRRQADYYCVHIFEAGGKRMAADAKAKLPAYIDLGHKPSPVLVVNEYKTAKAYGQFTKTLPAELVKVIAASLRAQPRTHLFAGGPAKDVPYTSSGSFTRWSNGRLRRIFGNDGVSVNTLRHSFRTHKHAAGTSYNQMVATARDMGHSLTTHLKYTHLGGEGEGSGEAAPALATDRIEPPSIS